MYKYIEPEVAGGLGNETIIDKNYHPPIVKKLHYEFNGWLGDDILESFPCFIVSERLKNEIIKKNLKGIVFEYVKITKSEEFIYLYPKTELPNFYWAIINGKFGTDDFIIANDYRLAINEKALQVLNLFNLKNAILEDYK